jgi:hypothetical protein
MLVNAVDPLSQPVGIEQGVDASQSVCAESRLSEPTLPEARPTDLFPSVAAAYPSPKQHQRRFHYRCGGNARSLSAVGNQGDNVFGELKDLFRIGDQATKNDYRFFS